MSEPGARWTIWLSAVLIIGYLLTVGLVASGALDDLSTGGGVDRTRAIASSTTYLVLALMCLAIVRNWRRARAQIVLVVASVVFVLILYEIAGRALSLPVGMLPWKKVASPQYHHINPPGQEMFVGVADDIPIIVRTNEDGLRSEYSRERFLEYGTRIAMLGDSFTFGFNVPEEAIFPTIVERTLREELGEDIAVLNAGIISYSPYLHRILYDGLVMHYRPELVLMFLDATDFGDDVRYPKETLIVDGEPRFELPGPKAEDVRYYGVVAQLPVWSWLSYPLDVFRRRVGLYDYYQFPDIEVGGMIAKNRFFVYRFPPQTTRPFFEATLKNIKAVDRAVRDAGGKFVLFITPRYHHWSSTECPDNWEAAEYENDEPFEFAYFEFFREVSSEVHFPIVDLLPEFQATDEYPLVFRHDPHWNARGHEFVGRHISHYLLHEYFER